jgi:hypothetical protein
MTGTFKGRGAAGEPMDVQLLDRDAAHARSIAKVLRASGANVEIEGSLKAETLDPSQVFVINYDSFTGEDPARWLESLEVLRRSGRLVLYSTTLSQNREQLIALLSRMGLTNFLARNVEVDAEELLATIQKILRKDIFGLEKYFPWGAQSVELTLSSSRRRRDVEELVLDFATRVGVQSRLANQLCTVADELVTNALYDAPVDGDRFRFASLSRVTEIELTPPEEVQLKLTCDGRRLGISVTDPFGSLTTGKVLDYLGRCFQKGDNQLERKAGGAGLGLYYIFESLSHFVVNVARRKRTEVIGLLDIRGSYKDFSARGKSFNLFVE